MYKNECRSFNGEYVIVWNDDLNITIGPEQIYGTLFCPVNFNFFETLEEAHTFIAENQLVYKPNPLLDVE